MPKRPRSHQIADLAINHVMGIFRAAGFACERHAGDYGEDLVVQPVHQEIVDPFRLYVQVKGAGTQPQRSVARRFDKEHLQKWIRSPELVIVVYWFGDANAAYFAIPIDQYSEWDLLSKRLPFLLKAEGELSIATVERLAWRARISNVNRMLVSSLNWTVDDPNDKAFQRAQERELVSISGLFLELIGFAESSKRGLRHTQTFVDVVKAISEEGITAEFDSVQLAVLAILFRIKGLASGCGVPGVLLEHSGKVLATLIDHATAAPRCPACGLPLNGATATSA